MLARPVSNQSLSLAQSKHKRHVAKASAVPLNMLNHPMVKASMNFMEKLNTIHREALLSSTYTLTQIDALLKHFVSQAQDSSPQQCKAAQIILSAWAKMEWQDTQPETQEKISSIINYCLQFPQDHAPLLIIAHRCLIDLVTDDRHPLAPILHDVIDMIQQLGLMQTNPLFLEQADHIDICISDRHWTKPLLQAFIIGTTAITLCHMWIESTWHLIIQS